MNTGLRTPQPVGNLLPVLRAGRRWLADKLLRRTTPRICIDRDDFILQSIMEDRAFVDSYNPERDLDARGRMGKARIRR